MDLCQQIMSLLFSMLSRLVKLFFQGKHLLISWPQSPSAVILEPKKIKSVTVSIVSISIATKWWDWMPWSSFFECCFKPAFSLSSFTFIKRLFSSSSFSAIRVGWATYLRQVGLIRTSASLWSEDVGTLLFVVWVLVAEAVLPSLRPGLLMTVLTFCNGNSFGEGSCHCNDVDLGAFLTPDISTQ